MEKGIFKAVSETTNQFVVGNLIQDVDEDGEVLLQNAFMECIT